MPAPTVSRRAFLKLATRLSLGMGATTVVGVGYTRYGEPNWLAVEQVDVPIRRLPAALHGLTIAHLSDLHLGEYVSEQYVAYAVELTQQQRPDLIALTGDFVTYGRNFIEPIAKLLAPLHAPLGVYAVLGNHDYWTGAQHQLMAALASSGVQTLRNASQHVPVGTAGLWLVGVDCVWVERADLPAAFAGVPGDAVRIVLVHEPDIADEVARYGADLQLSGHSHGGQVRLPLIGPVVLPRHGQRYPIGLQRVSDSPTHVYTSRGVGLVRPAVRFNCRPELALLRLVPDQS